MKEFEPFEIERYGKEETEVKSGFCPILREACIADRCMWWVRDWREESRKFQYDCAISLIAVGVNDESLHRVKEDE
jgi:hypothetical protein